VGVHQDHFTYPPPLRTKVPYALVCVLKGTPLLGIAIRPIIYGLRPALNSRLGNTLPAQPFLDQRIQPRLCCHRDVNGGRGMRKAL